MHINMLEMNMRPIEFARWFCLAVYFVFESSCSDTFRENMYRSAVTSYEPSAGDSVTTSQSARSRLECATLCVGNEKCMAFSFDKTVRECIMSNQEIRNTSGKHYVPQKSDCPTSDGYILLPGGICLKHHASTLPRDTAASICQSEDAHLLLLEDEAMHTAVKTYLTTVGCGNAWIDGRDSDKDNVYTSWKGGDLPYTKWAPNNPDNLDKMCVGVAPSSGYDLVDASCEVSVQFICQKEMP